jgi:transcriptional regulator with XRE-family HTH domain
MSKSLRSPRHQQLLDELIALRKAKGLTQTQVAERLGRPQSFVAKYEGGERRLDVIEFLDVADALGADPCQVLSDLRE